MQHGRFVYLKSISSVNVPEVTKRIVKDLRSRPYCTKKDFCILCLEGLVTLSIEDKKDPQFIKLGVLDVIMRIFRRFQRDLLVLKLVCSVLKNVGGCLRHIQHDGFSNKMIREIAQEDYFDDRNSAIAGALALSNFADNGLAAHLLTTNVVSDLERFIVGVANYHIEDEEVSGSILMLMRALLKHDTLKHQLINSIGPALITELMKAHFRAAKLQEDGCFVLFHAFLPISCHLYDVGHAVLSSLESNKTNKTDHHARYGCGIIFYLCVSTFGLAPLLNARTVKIVRDIAMLQLHSGNVQDFANKIFWAFAQDNTGLQLLKGMKIEIFVLESLKVNMKNMDVFASASGVLSNMITRENVETLTKLRLIDILIAGVKFHSRDEDALLNGLTSIRNIVHLVWANAPDEQLQVQIMEITSNNISLFKEHERLVSVCRQIQDYFV